MFIKFDSPRTSSLYMHHANAQVILEKIGKEFANSGIINANEIAQALQILEDWYKTLPRLPEVELTEPSEGDNWERENKKRELENNLPPTQKARLWPFIELLKEVVKQPTKYSYITWKSTIS